MDDDRRFDVDRRDCLVVVTALVGVGLVVLGLLVALVAVWERMNGR